jgi:hypothetical protein
MNQVIETILQHRSIRKFEDRPLSDEQIRTLSSVLKQHQHPALFKQRHPFNRGVFLIGRHDTI